jgi:hypothetical protein
MAVSLLTRSESGLLSSIIEDLLEASLREDMDNTP